MSSNLVDRDFEASAANRKWIAEFTYIWSATLALRCRLPIGRLHRYETHGGAMVWQYRDELAHPFESSFATLLAIKIVLAIRVLAHFIIAITLSARGKLRSRHFKLIHLSVFCHVVRIVFLAKAMFYITW